MPYTVLNNVTTRCTKSVVSGKVGSKFSHLWHSDSPEPYRIYLVISITFNLWAVDVGFRKLRQHNAIHAFSNNSNRVAAELTLIFIPGLGRAAPC